MAVTREICGTPAGYRRHLYYGEPTCEPCRAANRADREARIATPGRSEEVKARQAAQQRALRRVAREFPDRYREVLAEELLAAGVWAAGVWAIPSPEREQEGRP